MFFIYNINTLCFRTIDNEKRKNIYFICLVLLSACSPSSLDGIVIEKAADGYKLSIDGEKPILKA